MASKSKSHFVLVHGICHGGWCWYKLVHLLQQDGHTVTAINLKSAGTDPSLADSIHSFEEYNQPLMDFLAQLPSSEKIVLVGHSFGGVSLAYASEVFPEKIAVAVYVTAAMHRGGDRLQEEFKLLQLDEEIKKQLIHKFGDGPEQPPTSLVTPTTLQKYLFYGTSPSAVVWFMRYLLILVDQLCSSIHRLSCVHRLIDCDGDYHVVGDHCVQACAVMDHGCWNLCGPICGITHPYIPYVIGVSHFGSVPT